ncbi:hypothetical protein ACJX0J_006628, partial [Zea mays]
DQTCINFRVSHAFTFNFNHVFHVDQQRVDGNNTNLSLTGLCDTDDIILFESDQQLASLCLYPPLLIKDISLKIMMNVEQNIEHAEMNVYAANLVIHYSPDLLF